MTCVRHTLSTRSKVQFISITQQVAATVAQSGVQEGICIVFVPHTTAGVTINENADPDVIADITKEISKIIPFEDHYTHSEGNSAAHIKSSLFGSSLTLVVQSGRLLLGTWQTIYFSEFDGPRTRNFHVKVLSE
jgi:secondary thiamine-phosphate synthase enzyme